MRLYRHIDGQTYRKYHRLIARQIEEQTSYILFIMSMSLKIKLHRKLKATRIPNIFILFFLF